MRQWTREGPLGRLGPLNEGMTRMNNDNGLAKIGEQVLESIVLRGDLSGLSPTQRARFYVQTCENLGLNPHSQPFAYLRLNGKEVLYATRGATDQLAAIHKLNREIIDGPKVIDLAGTKVVYCVARATHPNGRIETATATVPFIDPVNVLMKAECLPLDSEILTRRGFKRYDAVKIGEEVLAYSTEADRCEWVPLENVSVYEDAPVSTFATARGGFSFRCTPDHKWAVRKPAYSPRSEAAPRGSYASRRPDTTLVEARRVKTHHRVIIAAPAESGDHPLPPDLAAVLGWIMCDGTIRRTGNHVALSIYQSKSDRVAEIRELLARAGLHPHESVGQPTVRTFPGGGTSVCLAQHKFSLRVEESKALLRAAGIEGPGDLPRLVTRLSQAARRAMLDAMMAADGTASGVFGKKRKPGVMDAWQILCTLEGIALGKMGTSSVGDVPVQQMLSYNYVAGNNLTLTDAGHEAVWCPTTKHGTWVTRQSGRISITGNTKAKRRVTLSILGLGILDETEVEMIPAQEKEPVAQVTRADIDAVRGLPSGVVKTPSIADLDNVTGQGARKSEPPPESEALTAWRSEVAGITTADAAVSLWIANRRALDAVAADARGILAQRVAELRACALPDAKRWLAAEVQAEDQRRATPPTEPDPEPPSTPPRGCKSARHPVAANDASAAPVEGTAAPASASQALDVVDAPGARSADGADLSTRRARRRHLVTKDHPRAVEASYAAHPDLPGYLDDCTARMTAIVAPDGTRLSALTARKRLVDARNKAMAKRAQSAMERAA